jgi:hypothetical protein
MENANVIAGVLMGIGAALWIASIISLVQTIGESKPGARRSFPFLLYRREELSENGQRSQDWYKFFCCGYCLCWGAAILISFWIAFAKQN